MIKIVYFLLVVFFASMALYFGLQLAWMPSLVCAIFCYSMAHHAKEV